MGYFFTQLLLLLLVSDIPVVCGVPKPSPDVACLPPIAGVLSVADVSTVAGIIAVSVFIAIAGCVCRQPCFGWYLYCS
jgi:hypothetical protein